MALSYRSWRASSLSACSASASAVMPMWNRAVIRSSSSASGVSWAAAVVVSIRHASRAASRMGIGFSFRLSGDCRRRPAGGTGKYDTQGPGMPVFPARGFWIPRRLLAGMRLGKWLRDRARNRRAGGGMLRHQASASEKQAAHCADADGEAHNAEGGFDGGWQAESWVRFLLNK